MNSKTVIKLSGVIVLILIICFFAKAYIFKMPGGEKSKHNNLVEENYSEEGNVDYDRNNSDAQGIGDNKDKKDDLSKGDTKGNGTDNKDNNRDVNNNNKDNGNNKVITNPSNNSGDKNDITSSYGKTIQREMQEENNILGKEIYSKKDLKIAIRGALRNFKAELNINIINLSEVDYRTAITEVINEYSEIDYGYSDSVYTYSSRNNGEVSMNYSFNYKLDRNALITQRNRVNSKVKSIIDQNIKSNMTKVQKELFFHDYIVNSAHYNTQYINQGIIYPADYTAYGILIDGKGVCEGYAKAFKLLCKSADITCIMVKGNANGPHAWNMVKLDDNQWYNVDVTWDDPIVADKSQTLIKTIHTYFNIPTSEINKNHAIASGYPTANGQRYLRDKLDIKEYDMDGNLFLKPGNINDFKKVVKAKLQGKSTVIPCRLSGFTLAQNDIFSIVRDVAAENSVSIGRINLLSDGTPIKYLKIKVEY